MVSDYVPVETEVTFSEEQLTALVSVALVDDVEIESNEMFSVFLATSQTDVIVVDGSTTVTILDNDSERTVLCTDNR